MTKPIKRTYNTQPPPDIAWQMGKTAASIKLANELGDIVLGADEEDMAFVLESIRKALREGKLVATDFIEI